MRKIRASYYAIFILRMLLLYIIFMVCRVAFAIYNGPIIGSIPWGEIPAILKGGLVFDSISILYVNLLFIVLTFIPFRFRERKGYQNLLIGIFVLFNAAALMVNIADIYYFPFKLSRIASDDTHFLAEGNFITLMWSFMKDYWSGLLFWIGSVLVLWIGAGWLFKFQPIRNRAKLTALPFFIIQIVLLIIISGFSIFAIRGFTLSKASYPISMSDASLYVKPQYASLTLSNPFCIIRTISQKHTSYTEYFDQEVADKIYPVEHPPLEAEPIVSIEGHPNIVILVVESFGSAHLKSFSDQFSAQQQSFTPFIDSLASQSYIFLNAFQNGLRSIDAMPAIWGSIPSFKIQFLSLPNSVTQYHALPTCLSEMGYNTMFLHGAVRKSMSFVSFGQMAGVEQFYSREDYEAKHGTSDFDGKWGIWDHKFLPFAKEKLTEAEEPFMATIFTLSSHHPYIIPEIVGKTFPEGNVPLQKAIAYSDYAIGEFFREASKESWFNNTLFIITADHGATPDNEKYRQMPHSYAVPLIFHYTGNDLYINKESDYISSEQKTKGDVTETEAPAATHTATRNRFIGRNLRTTQHIDIMPTLLRMLGYEHPFFAFGRDVFNDSDAGFAIDYYGSTFNYMRDSMRYLFNEQDVVGVYNYKKDYMAKHNIDTLSAQDSLNIEQMKAFIQQYYYRVKERSLTLRAPANEKQTAPSSIEKAR